MKALPLIITASMFLGSVAMMVRTVKPRPSHEKASPAASGTSSDPKTVRNSSKPQELPPVVSTPRDWRAKPKLPPSSLSGYRVVEVPGNPGPHGISYYQLVIRDGY